MSKKLLGLSVAGVAFALVLAFGVSGTAMAQQWRVDRDLGAFNSDDANQFGDDRAYNSAHGPDRDMDAQEYNFSPPLHGLGGDDAYRSGY